MSAQTIKLGRCYSPLGVPVTPALAEKYEIFRHPLVAERVAFATERVWQYLNHPRNTELLIGLGRALPAEGKTTAKLQIAGLVADAYRHIGRGWLTFGLRFFSPLAEEYGAVREAQRIIADAGDPAGRRAYFGMLGIKQSGLERLSADQFRALLFKLASDFNFPKMPGISSVRVTDKKYPLSLIEDEGGGRTILISTAALERTSGRADPNLLLFT